MLGKHSINHALSPVQSLCFLASGTTPLPLCISELAFGWMAADHPNVQSILTLGRRLMGEGLAVYA